MVFQRLQYSNLGRGHKYEKFSGISGNDRHAPLFRLLGGLVGGGPFGQEHVKLGGGARPLVLLPADPARNVLRVLVLEMRIISPSVCFQRISAITRLAMCKMVSMIDKILSLSLV